MRARQSPLLSYFLSSLLIFFVFLPTSRVYGVSTITINATVPAICGNSVQEGAETCDDGNVVSGDGCSNICAVEQAQNNNNNNNGAPPAPAPVPVPVVPPPPPDPVPAPVPDPVPAPQPEPAPQPQPQPEPAPAPAPAGQNENPAGGQNDAAGAGDNGAGANAGGNAAAGNNAGGNGDGGAAASNGGASNGGGVLPSVFSGATSFVPAGEHISRSALHFFIGNGSFLAQTPTGIVTTVVGDQFLLSINEYDLSSRPIKSLTATLFGDTKTFSWNVQNQRYEVTFKVVEIGKADGILAILYADGSADSQTFGVVGLSAGVIKDADTNGLLAEAKVTLLDVSSGGIVWNAIKFHQVNPVQTGRTGSYAFVVPAGRYSLRIEKEGYRTKEINEFETVDFFIRKEVVMIKAAPSLKEAIEKNAPLSTNIKNVAIAVGEKTKEYAQVAKQVVKESVEVIDKVADNPKVEQVTEQVVAPTVTTVAVATVVPSLWSMVLPLLRFVFLQPVLLFGKKKRKEWGMVYNSLNKLPVDLAVVRLIDKKTKRVKQSRVTDLQGRFLFMSEPGEYTIEVTKPGFVFPSHVLSKVQSDGKMVDIYHGETVGVTKAGSVVTPNIPVDPAGEQKTPQRIIKEKRILIVQHAVSLFGVVLTALSVYIAPTWYMWVFLGLQIGMYFLFRLFVKPKKPKGWGIVYDAGSKKPIGSVVIRLFTKEYNKLVSTQTTDGAGRYAFLVGPSEYYITVEKQGYESFQSKNIKVEAEQAKGSVLKQDVSIKKK